MKFDISFCLAMSCSIPAFIGMFRYKKLSPLVQKFAYIVFLALLTELLAKNFIELKCRTAVVVTYNIYILLNLFLYVIFFTATRVLQQKSKYLLSIFVIIIWLLFFIVYHWQKVYMLVQAVSGIFYCILAIALLNKNLFTTKIQFLNNSLVIISIGILLQYLFFGLNVLTMFITTLSTHTRSSIFKTYEIANAFSYLLFAYAFILNNYSKK